MSQYTWHSSRLDGSSQFQFVINPPIGLSDATKLQVNLMSIGAAVARTNMEWLNWFTSFCSSQRHHQKQPKSSGSREKRKKQQWLDVLMCAKMVSWVKKCYGTPFSTSVGLGGIRQAWFRHSTWFAARSTNTAQNHVGVVAPPYPMQTTTLQLICTVTTLVRVIRVDSRATQSSFCH